MAELRSEDVKKILDDLEMELKAERREAIFTFHDIKAKRLEWQIITIDIVQRRLDRLIKIAE